MMYNSTESSVHVVGIIGAGAAGLSALKHVLNEPGFVPHIWEKSKVLGGTWVYTNNLDEDEHGLPVHSSMYKSLRTNLPKEIMAFPDFPFRAGPESYVHHSQVLSYLQDYASHFDLEKHIKFEHMVEHVTPRTPGSSSTDWLVTVRDLNANTNSTTICHSIIVCNGHYSVPRVPVLPGLEGYSGTVLHSHSYREPCEFRSKRVAVLGAAASGIDIALELATVADKVFLSHNHPFPIPSTMPPNVQQVAGIERLKPGCADTFMLCDGSDIQADALLFCTGYHYTFPFLSAECGVTVKDNHVQPLYRHLVHCHYPSMAFVGIPYKILPFPVFDIQVRYFLYCVLQAPSSAATQIPASADELPSGVQPRHHHCLATKQWSYFHQLQSDIKTTGREVPVRDQYMACIKQVTYLSVARQLLQVSEFRKYTYKICSTPLIVIEKRDGHSTWRWLEVCLLALYRAPGVLFAGLRMRTTRFLLWARLYPLTFLFS